MMPFASWTRYGRCDFNHATCIGVQFRHLVDRIVDESVWL